MDNPVVKTPMPSRSGNGVSVYDEANDIIRTFNSKNGMSILVDPDNNITISNKFSGEGVSVGDEDSDDFSTIAEAIASGSEYIYVRNGVYNEGTLHITNDNVKIVGESKINTKIIVPVGEDGVAIYSNNCVIANLTIDAETNNAEAALVIGDGSEAGLPITSKGCSNLIDNCIIKGGDHIFAIYIAGASTSVGTETLTYYENKDLEINNTVVNCTFYSNWDGDSFSFSLQKLMLVKNNTFYNGRVAYYMNRDSLFIDNRMFNSNNQGMFIGSPCNDNKITGNIISEASSSGIKIQNQVEHMPLLTGQCAKNNIIKDNIIYMPLGNGIEITGTVDHEHYNNIINGNMITKPGDHGIYLNNAKANNISNNVINEPKTSESSTRGSGIYMVIGVTDNTISSNTIYDMREPYGCHGGIINREDSECTGNIITDNNIDANNSERSIWIKSANTIVKGNSVSGGYYAGILLEGVSGCLISDNKFQNNCRESNNTYYEVWIKGSSSNISINNNIIIGTSDGNNMYGCINIESDSVTNYIENSNLFIGPYTIDKSIG